MDEETFKKYLHERYEDQVSWYDQKSMWNQKKYKQYQFILIILSAITPALIGIDFAYSNPYLRFIPLITAVIVAILTSSLATFKYQENWINYRTICETLKKELYFYEASTEDYRASDDREALFVERVESIISRENTLWINVCAEKIKGGI